MKDQLEVRQPSKKGQVMLEVSSCRFRETRTDIACFLLLTEKPVRGPTEHVGSGGDQAEGMFSHSVGAVLVGLGTSTSAGHPYPNPRVFATFRPLTWIRPGLGAR